MPCTFTASRAFAATLRKHSLRTGVLPWQLQALQQSLDTSMTNDNLSP